MPRLAPLDVLLALLEPSNTWGVTGDDVMARLAEGGAPASAAKVFARLLQLEKRGLVRVDRDGEHRFHLTAAGEEEAYAHGPGAPVEVTLVMADLVGFVAFTDRRGDEAAHRTAWHFARCAEQALESGAGEAVKGLGDGVLGTAPSTEAAVVAVKALAEHCRSIDDEAWEIRAAVHDGRPVRHRGDLFGADVNLVARLCQAAKPGEVLVTGRGGEALQIRGLERPVVVERLAL